jgi:hypothetical protein
MGAKSPQHRYLKGEEIRVPVLKFKFYQWNIFLPFPLNFCFLKQDNNCMQMFGDIFISFLVHNTN